MIRHWILSSVGSSTGVISHLILSAIGNRTDGRRLWIFNTVRTNDFTFYCVHLYAVQFVAVQLNTMSTCSLFVFLYIRGGLDVPIFENQNSYPSYQAEMDRKKDSPSIRA